jgi:replicative DNA helicase
VQTIVQGRRKNSAAGEPIHLPFACMTSTKTFIRRGELTLIAAGPGTGKSAFVQAIAQRGNDRGQVNTSIYFSADSDSATMFKRAAAIHSGWVQSDIENIMENGDRRGVEAAVNAATSHMRWSFESSPSEEHIMLEIEAYAATFGEFPEILIFDNTKDISMGVGEGEFQMLEEACVFMKGLARDTNAAVIALHHCTGALEDGLQPIPLSGLRGKISKTPATVLTLYRGEGGKQLRVSPVKVRSGVADASGNWSLPIAIDLNRMSFTG